MITCTGGVGASRAASIERRDIARPRRRLRLKAIRKRAAARREARMV
jgi:hypothetical protein